MEWSSLPVILRFCAMPGADISCDVIRCANLTSEFSQVQFPAQSFGRMFNMNRAAFPAGGEEVRQMGGQMGRGRDGD